MLVLPVNGCHYYVPISSAKPKHQRMSNSLDFHKLQDTDTGYLYAVLNLNNMIPVPDSCITQLKYSQIEQFRSFSNEKEKNDYIYLLQKEKAIMDSIQSTLQNKAEKLYAKCLRIPDSSLASRYCNFKLLEEKCNSYLEQQAPINHLNDSNRINFFPLKSNLHFIAPDNSTIRHLLNSFFCNTKSTF